MPDHYCRLLDVSAINSQREYNMDSKPNGVQVMQMIEATAVEMDTRLAVIGVNTPIIIGDKDLAFLRVVCTYGASAKAEESTRNLSGNLLKAPTPRYKWLQEQFEKRMVWLEANPTALGDTQAANEIIFDSYFVQNENAIDLEPRIEIDQVF